MGDPPMRLNDAHVALYQKLWAVMSDCGYIRKDKENSFHRYKYASEAAIKEKLHESLVKHRLLFLPSIVEFTERVGMGKDGKESLTVAKVMFRFVDIDSGACESGTFYGTGIDNADKGMYKACTGALKYILTSWFLIPTGDDPEAEHERKKVRGKQEDEPAGVRRNTPEQQREFAQQRIAQVAQRVEPITTAAPVDPKDSRTAAIVTITKSFESAKWKSTVLPKFKEIKLYMTSLRGESGEKRYYETLALFNAEKATDFEGRIPDARLCYEALASQAIAWEPKDE